MSGGGPGAGPRPRTPSYRGRGLAGWVKRRTLTSLAEAGVREAWAPILHRPPRITSVNASLGYRPAATTVGLGRRLSR